MDAYATHLPLLAACVHRTRGPVLELGSGDYSTPLLHALCSRSIESEAPRTVVTLDSDAVWLARYDDLRTPWHAIELVTDWAARDFRVVERARACADRIWSVAFVDHSPGEQRVASIERLRNLAQWIVVHDTEAACYGYEPLLSSFKYRYDDRRQSTWTTVLSMTEEFAPYRVVHPKTKIISFSVFGSKPMYLRGAVRNAELAPTIYPGWTARFYCERGLPILGELRALGAEVVEMPPEPGVSGAFWRFLAAAEPNVERVIFRDADSRLNVREKAAVDAWVESGRAGHIMRDHPQHTGCPVLAGMWGVLGGRLYGIAADIALWPRKAIKGDDQAFLAAVVYPRVGDWLAHGVDGSVWPPHSPYSGFVGEVCGENT